VVVGIGISSPLKYLLEKIKHFKKSFVIFFVKKWCYWELFGNIREHKTYQGRWENQKKICFSSLTHTHTCALGTGHTLVKKYYSWVLE
jgi:hypothetical protein